MTNKVIEELKNLEMDIHKLKRHQVYSPFLNLPGMEKETVGLNSVINIVHKYMEKIKGLEKETTVSEAIERLAEEYPLNPVQIQYMLENAGKHSVNIEIGTKYSDNVEYGTREKEKKYKNKVVDVLFVDGEELTAVINKYRDLNYGVEVSVEFVEEQLFDDLSVSNDEYTLKIIKAIEVDEDVR